MPGFPICNASPTPSALLGSKTLLVTRSDLVLRLPSQLLMSAPIYSQALRPRMLVTRWFDPIRRLVQPRARKSSVQLRRAFFIQAGWQDAVTFGAKARAHFAGLPFESVEGELHRIWNDNDREDWSSVRGAVRRGWNEVGPIS